MYFLVDCNNFYVSCERVFRPDLNHKPVVVLSNNDGCVISRSNEAKALGIPMGAPAYQFQPLFDEHHVHVFSSNFALYGDMSSRVMHILAKYTPDMEIYSIDEAFLQWQSAETLSMEEVGMKIREDVLRSTGIPVSVGIAPTKTLAKVAAHIVKKFPERTRGVYVIDDNEKRLKALKWLPVEEVWGIGRQHAKNLNKKGIHVALGLLQLSDHWIKKNMSIVGLRLKRELEGIPSIAMEQPTAKRSIAVTRSFEKMYTTFDELHERVVTFAVSCAEKLRQQQSVCHALMVFVHTNYFREDMPQYAKNVVITLPYATNSSLELAQFAVEGLKRIFVEGYHYKKAGVIVMHLEPEMPTQLHLFANSNPKHKALMEAIDHLTHQFGQQKVMLAAQDPGRKWKMKQERLSPCYTTQWNDLITIYT